VPVRCIVVGAGITGLAVARELRSRGVEVVVLERTGIAAGASGVQPGGVRRQWGTRIACRLAAESVRFWDGAAERLDSRVPLTFTRCGYLFAAHSDATLDRLTANVALQNEEGVPSRIVTPDEAAALVPGLQPDELAGGAWCADDGYFDRPQAVVEAFASGLDVRHHQVLAITRRGGTWRVDHLDAEAVVVAAGVDSRDLVSGLRLEAEERHLFLSDPIPERLLEPLVVAPELAFAAKQLADGRVLASDLSGRSRDHIRGAIRRLLPRLEYVSFTVPVPGVYDVTPDHQPLLGPVDDGLHVACGFSGHGFMIAPAVARIVAGGVLGANDEALDILGPDRFEHGRPVPEPQLV
jgi:sarcosine oxidase, subunit beta